MTEVASPLDFRSGGRSYRQEYNRDFPSPAWSEGRSTGAATRPAESVGRASYTTTRGLRPDQEAARPQRALTAFESELYGIELDRSATTYGGEFAVPKRTFNGSSGGRFAPGAAGRRALDRARRWREEADERDAELPSDLEGITEQIGDISVTRRKIEADVEELFQQLPPSASPQKEARNTRTQEDLVATKYELEKARVELSSITARHTGLEEEVVSLRSFTTDLKAKLNAARAIINDQQMELKEQEISSEKSLTQLKETGGRERARLERTLQELQHRLDVDAMKNSVIEQKVRITEENCAREVDTVKQAHQRALGEVTAQLVAANRRCGEVDRQRDEAAAALGEAKVELDKIRRETDHHTDQMKALQHRMEEVSVEEKTAQRRLREAQRDLERERGAREGAELEKAGALARLADIERAQTRRFEEGKDAQDVARLLESDKEKLERDLLFAREHIGVVEQERADLRAELAVTVDRVTRLTKESEARNDDLEAQGEKIRNLLDDLQRYKTDLQAAMEKSRVTEQARDMQFQKTEAAVRRAELAERTLANKEVELSDVKGRIAGTQGDREAASNELQTALRQLRAAESELKAREAETARAGRRVELLEQQMETARTELESTREAGRTLEREKAAAQADASTAAQERLQKENSLRLANDQISLLKVDNDRLRAEASEARRLGLDRVSLSSEVAAARADGTKLGRDLENALVAKASAEDRLRQLEHDHAAGRAEIEALRGERDALKEGLHRTRELVANLQDEVSRRQGERDKLDVEARNLLREKMDLELALERAKSGESVVQKTMGEMLTSQEANLEQIRSLEHKLNLQKIAADSIAKERAAAEMALAGSRERLAALQETLDRQEGSMKETSESVRRVTEENLSLAGNLEVMRSDRDRHESEVARGKELYRELERQVGKQADAFRSQLNAITTEIETLHRDKIALSSDLTSAKHEVAALRQTTTTAIADLEGARQEEAAKDEEIAALRAQIRELRDKNRRKSQTMEHQLRDQQEVDNEDMLRLKNTIEQLRRQMREQEMQNERIAMERDALSEMAAALRIEKSREAEERARIQDEYLIKLKVEKSKRDTVKDEMLMREEARATDDMKTEEHSQQMQDEIKRLREQVYQAETRLAEAEVFTGDAKDIRELMARKRELEETNRKVMEKNLHQESRLRHLEEKLITVEDDLRRATFELEKRPQQKVRALYPSTPTIDNELALEQGEVLVVLENHGHWWKGTNSRGRTGFFPKNYVEPLMDEPAGGSMARKDDPRGPGGYSR